MKRTAQPTLSPPGELVLSRYEQRLCTEEDLSAMTIRNYLSDLRQFAAWCESIWQSGREEAVCFTPEAVSTPTLIDYRTYLRQSALLKPNSVNRALVSLKRYFAWLVSIGQLKYDPTRVIKLVEEEVTPPRHLEDWEEQALVAAVTEVGSKRDQAVIVLMLHTGLRAREVCTLTRAHVRLGKRSGTILVHGNAINIVKFRSTQRHGQHLRHMIHLSPNHSPRIQQRCSSQRSDSRALLNEDWAISSRNMRNERSSMM